MIRLDRNNGPVHIIIVYTLDTCNANRHIDYVHVLPCTWRALERRESVCACDQRKRGTNNHIYRSPVFKTCEVIVILLQGNGWVYMGNPIVKLIATPMLCHATKHLSSFSCSSPTFIFDYPLQSESFVLDTIPNFFSFNTKLYFYSSCCH